MLVSRSSICRSNAACKLSSSLIWVTSLSASSRVKRDRVRSVVCVTASSNRSRSASCLPLAALNQALGERRPEPGLIHHSDQGTQYASNKYVNKLRENAVKISMSRKS